MKLLRAVLSIVPIMLVSITGYSQAYNHGNNELYVCEGFLSYDQFAGIFGNYSPVNNNISFPYTISGAAFITYRHYFSERFAAGISLGLDNQTGDLSYGPKGYYGYTGTSGYYKREVYTVAAELLGLYHTEERFKIYGYAGLGYTSSKTTYNFFPGIKYRDLFYGTPHSAFLKNSTTLDFSHFNGQITPLGFRSGETVAAFIEFGFGYKGLISGGLSVKINNPKHKPKEPENKEVLFIPYEFPVDSTLIPLRKVITGNPAFDHSAFWPYGHRDSIHLRFGNFYDQLDKLSLKTRQMNGNVFMITKIKDAKLHDRYNIKGIAYTAPDFENFKKAQLEKKQQKFKNEQCAYLTIYRPDYNRSFSRLIRSHISINDSTKLILGENIKYVCTLTKEGTYTIADNNGRHMKHITVKFGNEYYLKTYVPFHSAFGALFTHPQIQSVSTIQGSLECDLIKTVKDLEIKE